MPHPILHDSTPPGFQGRIGLARAEITPPVGILHRNWGAATHEQAEGVHRPLYATVMTIRAPWGDSPPLVFVDLDLGWWRDREEPELLRSHLCRAFGLPDSNLLVALTHTHAGPVLSRASAAKPGGDLVGPWLDKLRLRCAELVREALDEAELATITWARGRCALATQRDLPEPASERYVCGHCPDAPADDTLIVGRITDPWGRIRATWVNYACHPTTLGWGNRLLSPDYVGALRETVEQATQGLCLFLLGACGELAPALQYSDDPRLADRHGRALGHAVLSTLETLPPPNRALHYAGTVESGAPLAVWELVEAEPPGNLLAHRLDLELPLKPDLPSLESIEAQLAAPESLDVYATERLRRLRGVRSMFGAGTTAREGVWFWQLGDAWIVASPFEAYASLQTTVRAACPDIVLVGNVVNGWRGYLPPAAHYPRDQYSVWQTPFAPGGLELLTQKVLGALA